MTPTGGANSLSAFASKAFGAVQRFETGTWSPACTAVTLSLLLGILSVFQWWNSHFKAVPGAGSKALVLAI